MILRLILAALVLATGMALAAPPAPPVEAEDSFSLMVREAVTAEDDNRLFQLALAEPWRFREVANQLADLAVQQRAENSPGEAFNRLVIAGHLAAIYLEVAGDGSLAVRLRNMLDWTGTDMQERAAVDELLSRIETDSPPALKELGRALKTCERLADRRCSGLVHAGVGRLMERDGKTSIAAAQFEKAAGEFREAGELRRLRDAQISRGQLLLQASELKGAADALGAAAALSQEIEDAAGEAGSMMLLAETLVASRRTDRALDALSRARDVALAADLPDIAARAILARTLLRDSAGPRSGGPEDYEAAARLATQAEDLVVAAQAYAGAARAHLAAGNQAGAAETVEKALSAARLAGLDDETGGLLLLAADIHGDLGQWDRALRRAGEALALANKLGSDEARQPALARLGTLYLETGRHEEAAAPLREAARLAEAAGNTAAHGRAEGGLGAVALARGDLDQARDHYQRSADLLFKAGDRFEATRMRGIIRRIDQSTSGGR